MRLTMLLLGLLLLGTSGATTPAWKLDRPAEHRTPEPFLVDYCQQPDFDAVYNMSTGFNSESAS